MRRSCITCAIAIVKVILSAAAVGRSLVVVSGVAAIAGVVLDAIRAATAIASGNFVSTSTAAIALSRGRYLLRWQCTIQERAYILGLCRNANSHLSDANVWPESMAKHQLPLHTGR